MKMTIPSTVGGAASTAATQCGCSIVEHASWAKGSA
jgi:hypothetical protein